jgi:hypothetical protein
MAHPLCVWRQLLAPAQQPLRDAAAEVDPREVNAVGHLRERWDQPLVAAALALAEARRKATEKFADRAAHLIADPEGVEQATSLAVARHKAKRFKAAGDGAAVADLACGIGGDAMGLAEAGLGVLAIDHQPARAWMAWHNAGCPAAASDVAGLNLMGRLCHLDPGRRSERGRSRQIAHGSPGPESIDRIHEKAQGLGLKLSPAIDPDEVGWPGQLEFISERGRLVQAVLWTGALAAAEPGAAEGTDGPTASSDAPAASRRATRLDEHTTVTLAGEPAPPPLGPMQRYLFAVDPSVERAQLMSRLCETLGLAAVHPSLGLLSGDQPLDSPWLTGFELLTHMPWRLKRVKQWLAQRDGGVIEVKTRGRAVDPDRAQKQLRGAGQTPYTVFILRWDQTRIALVTRRMSTQPTASD